MSGEGARPCVAVAHVVDRAVPAELLPHEPGVVVGHRPVPVVRVGEWRALSEITVLTGARARDHVPAAIPAGHLPRRGELAPGALAVRSGRPARDTGGRPEARRVG